MTTSISKQNAARKALEWVEDRMLIGLGTGSTSNCFLKALAEKIRGENLNIHTVSSSFSTTLLARDLGIPLLPLETVDEMDLYVDSADEVDPGLNLIKGGGGAMVMEKVMCDCAVKFIVIVDESKIVKYLGETCRVPVEVIPQARTQCINRLVQLGGEPLLRQAERKAGPVISDNGNFILDVKFSQTVNFSALDTKINAIPGVVGHGIFIGAAFAVVVGSAQSARVIQV